MKLINRLAISTVVVVMAISFHALPATADSQISVNFNISGNDNNSVETAVGGLVPVGAVDVDGSGWNNVITRGSGDGDATTLTTASPINLIDNSTVNAAILTAAGGSFYSHFTDNVDNVANRGAFGEAGLMQSDLLLNTSESITISGLSTEYTDNGYDLFLFFGGDLDRSYGFNVNDGTVDLDVYIDDDANPDADADDDGLIEWIAATGNTLGTATDDATYAKFADLDGSSFTISGLAGSGGRSSLTGFQIVAKPAVPEPTSIAIWSLLGLCLAGYGYRRRRNS